MSVATFTKSKSECQGFSQCFDHTCHDVDSYASTFTTITNLRTVAMLKCRSGLLAATGSLSCIIYNTQQEDGKHSEHSK